MQKSEEANIVVLCDGTWNSPYVETNVYRLYKLLIKAREPYVPETKEFHEKEYRTFGDYYYEAGVGGMVDVIDATFAEELDTKIKNAYRHIVKRYNHEDNKTKRNKEIWLLGFSRGAYTVRCVGGIIRNCGILRYDSDELIDRAHELYRSRNPNHDPNGQESENFRKSFSHPIESVTIKFLGLWDTVGAHGIPTLTIGKGFEYLKLHNLIVSKMVKNVYQALSIHERVSLFEPCRIFRNNEECGKCEECRKGEGIRKKSECANIKKIKLETNLEEIWFPGDHLEVGGGIYSIDQCISNESLLWMIRKIIYTGGLLSEKRLEEERLEDLKRLEKRFKEIEADLIKLQLHKPPFFTQLKQNVLSTLPIFTIKRGFSYVPFMYRDRTIPLYRDDENKLTLDLLYNEGDWSKFNRKKLEKINEKKPNSLTKFYEAMGDILIEELKMVKIDDDTKVVETESFSSLTISKFDLQWKYNTSND